MTVGELVEMRKAAGLTQTEMADWMGMSMRGYQDVEKGDPGATLSARHRHLVESATFRIAVERGDPMLTTAAVRDAALRLVEMIRGG